MSRFRVHALLLGASFALSVLAAPAARADSVEACRDTGMLERLPPMVNLYVENDLFAQQDQGYTNGLRLSFVSPNLRDLQGDPCLPALAGQVNALFDALVPNAHAHEELNMVFSVGQQMYTPTDESATGLIEDDRPYAGWLYLGFGYNARLGDRLRSTELNVGIIGPASLAKEAQDFIHRLRGIDRFQGWDNQLGAELGLQLVHERKRRRALHFGPWQRSDWGWDLITHYGASVGNVATYANAGGELRFGLNLPDDFGTSPARPAGDNNAPPPVGGQRRQLDGWHVFASGNARWVLRDIFLDGNTFSDSHRVDKRPFVADAALGVAFYVGDWKLAFARYFRSREFDGQRERPSFGSFTISRAL